MTWVAGRLTGATNNTWVFLGRFNEAEEARAAAVATRSELAFYALDNGGESLISPQYPVRRGQFCGVCGGERCE